MAVSCPTITEITKLEKKFNCGVNCTHSETAEIAHKNRLYRAKRLLTIHNSMKMLVHQPLLKNILKTYVEAVHLMHQKESGLSQTTGTPID